VSVQVASSVLAERLPAICGSDTFTTVVSSTSMNVLDMTATAINQGLMSGRACGWELIVTEYDSSYIRFALLVIGFSEKLILRHSRFDARFVLRYFASCMLDAI
jgi:hypothetical protein